MIHQKLTNKKRGKKRGTPRNGWLSAAGKPPARTGNSKSMVRIAQLVAACLVLPFCAGAFGEEPANESKLLGGVRQLTFEGRRSGEGYFSADGSRLIFQSERDPANPFFQIFAMDFETGDVTEVSPGNGKTTCSWLHPTADKALFASTHGDPDAEKKQRDELELRARGEERRYSWDYDENYEIYEYDFRTKSYGNLTNSKGYDAEGSYSPDGSLIAFASNRDAYERVLTGDLTGKLKGDFQRDQSLLMDIYIMNADGSDVRRLTDVDGYDGGPFFSPDGRRICWRRFSTDGAIAEVMTMEIDGSDQRQITRLGAMSWAPFYHPSGDYLIFTTNKHGFANFELYLVSVDGKSPLVRVTNTDGFDGLAAFSPDGKKLVWTSNRTPQKQSQLFIADWNDGLARELLGLGKAGEKAAATVDGDADGASAAKAAAHSAAGETKTTFTAPDILRHVDYLCRPELEGRLTGTAGERLATEYVAAYFNALGLAPAGDNGSWFQEFEFTSGVSLGPNNRFAMGDRTFEINNEWRPLAFSQNNDVSLMEVVFAGYGIRAAAEDERDEYDSYVDLDVEGKWVMVFRYLPEDISSERRQKLNRYAHLRFKTTVAMQNGAAGLIVVSGPNAKARKQLVPLRNDGTLSGSGIPVISITDDVAAEILQASGKDLKTLQDALDTGEHQMGFVLDDVKLSAQIDVQQIKSHGRNVLGRLAVGDQPTEQIVVVGAHIDHLGRGSGGSSLARDDEAEQIHFGADDNASGVAAMLETAEYLSKQKKAGKFDARRDCIFAAWSGEELGLLGSNHFVAQRAISSNHGKGSNEREDADDMAAIYPAIAAYINFDMVGRLEKNVVLQGVGSSSVWPKEIEQRNVPVGLPVVLQRDSMLPTDTTSFFNRGVPAISAFTGSHEEYHTPRDTADLLNYEGAARIARLMALVTRSIAMLEQPPDYVAQSKSDGKERPRARMRAYLGTIPDYAAADIAGVKLSGVAKDGPAGKAGVKGGDIIVELGGKKIANIYDYTYAIESLKIDQPIKIAIQRKGQRIEMQIVPSSRE
jgi:Tol biopolymer transport system component